MFFRKNKNKIQFFTSCLAIFIVAGSLFFVGAPDVFAQTQASDTTWWSWPFRWLLYGVFQLVGLLTSAAVTLLEWIINPAFISGDTGILNKKSVYEMWKFIRDFFNLFFILVLLYTAFTIVFQVAKDYKKALLSIVLAALFINFSFPVSRFIIDVGNVPMYFFADQIIQATQKSTVGTAMGAVLGTSQLDKLLLPKGDGEDVSNILVAIVFMFIFSITLLVLAVQFVFRFIGLIILVIFSPVGFAASIIPGMEKYASMWWDKFIQYVLFGPAAMLMLLIAIRFMVEIKIDGTSVTAKQAAANLTSSGFGGDTAAAMAMFTIPIILLWMTIGMASSFSIAGAGAVSGWGTGAARWVGRKTWGGTKWLGYKNPMARGIGQGLKEQVTTRFPGKQILAPSRFEAGARGIFGRGTRRGELESLDQKAAYEEAKKMKERNAGNSELKEALHGKDKKQAAAAAIVLSERKAIDTADDFAAALAVLGKNTKEVSSLIANTDSGSLKFDDEKKDKDGKTQLDRVMEAPAYSVNSKLRGDLEGRMKKEGQAKMTIEYKIKEQTKKGRSLEEARSEVYADTLDKYSADDLAKQSSLFEDMKSNPQLTKYVQDRVNLSAKGFQDAYSKANAKVQENWIKADINLQGSQTPQAASKEKEEMDKRRQKLKETREKNGR